VSLLIIATYALDFIESLGTNGAGFFFAVGLATCGPAEQSGNMPIALWAPRLSSRPTRWDSRSSIYR